MFSIGDKVRLKAIDELESFDVCNDRYKNFFRTNQGKTFTIRHTTINPLGEQKYIFLCDIDDIYLFPSEIVLVEPSGYNINEFVTLI